LWHKNVVYSISLILNFCVKGVALTCLLKSTYITPVLADIKFSALTCEQEKHLLFC